MLRSAWNRGGAGSQHSNFQRANDSKEMWARELPLLVDKNRQLGDSPGAARPFAPPSAPAPWHTQAIAAMTPQNQGNLQRKNLHQTRAGAGVSLSWTPTQPRRSVLDYLPAIFTPNPTTKGMVHQKWQILALSLLVVVTALLGTLLFTFVSDLEASLRAGYIAGQKLPPLQTQVLQGLQQEDPSETDEVRMLNKYIVTPEKSRDEKWMGGTLALAEAMIAGHHGHHVMFIGDVFEQWTGKDRGEECKSNYKDCMSTKLLTEQMFSELYKPMVNSLNGETTQNLLWRITQLEGFNKTAPWVCVLNIGQADLEGGRTPDEAAAGIREVLRTLQSMWLNTEFVLMAMLPRADDLFRHQMKKLRGSSKGRSADPVGAIKQLPIEESAWFNKVNTVNRWILKLSNNQYQKDKPDIQTPVSYVDCNSNFIVAGEERIVGPPLQFIPLELMEDGSSHTLTPHGHQLLAKCLQKPLLYLRDKHQKDEDQGVTKLRDRNRKARQKQGVFGLPDLFKFNVVKQYDGDKPLAEHP